MFKVNKIYFCFTFLRYLNKNSLRQSSRKCVSSHIICWFVNGLLSLICIPVCACFPESLRTTWKSWLVLVVQLSLGFAALILALDVLLAAVVFLVPMWWYRVRNSRISCRCWFGMSGRWFHHLIPMWACGSNGCFEPQTRSSLYWQKLASHRRVLIIKIWRT